MARTAFIIGGTGMIGIATAAELLRAGWRVTMSHTGKRAADNVPAGAEIVALDRGDTEAMRSALGTGVDALVDMVAFNGLHGDQLLSLADLTGILAVISSASVYADPQGRSIDTAGETGFPEFAGPIRETAATIEPGTGSYSRAKVELEQRLLAGPARPITILRPCAIHGINAKHPREWWFIKRMLDGRTTIPLAGGGGALFHTTASINLARLIHAAIETPATRILNCGDPDAPSLLEIGEALASQLDWAGAFVPVPADSPIGQTPWSTPSPFLVDMHAASALDYTPASYVDALPAYVAWMKSRAATWRETFPAFAHYPADPFDYAAEDTALGLLA